VYIRVGSLVVGDVGDSIRSTEVEEPTGKSDGPFAGGLAIVEVIRQSWPTRYRTGITVKFACRDIWSSLY
jgi:hypothetical protein